MTDSISEGYAQSTPRVAAEKEAKADRALAASFAPDSQMERLIALRSEDREAYKTIVHGPTRMALANYERAKSAHEKYGN